MIATRRSWIVALVVLACKWTVIFAGTNDPFFKDLSDAVHKDDPLLIDMVLKKGANINSQSAKGLQTALMQAVLHGKERAVAHLLKKGADASIAEKNGYTPMHGAGFQGRPGIAKILMDYGVPLRDVHKDGFEPIHRACWGKEGRHTSTVKFFLENGVPVDEIFYACMEKSENDDTKRLLVDWMNNRKERKDQYEKKVAKEKKDKTKATATKKKYKPVVVEDDEYLDEDFQEAAENQDLKTMERLIKQGANINNRAKGSLQTPLMMSVLRGLDKSVKFLLKNGADVNIAEKDGYTPMHGAAYQGRVNIAKILHDHGVPLRVQHSDSHEPIVRACWGKEKRHTDTVEFFLENGVPFFEVFDQCMSSTGNRMTKQLLQKWMENGGVGTKGSNFIEL